MKLAIHNFSKLKDVHIDIDGITVIAGNNNTGKSTIGKIVFSVFNSLCQNEDKIEKEISLEFEKTVSTILKEYVNNIRASRLKMRSVTRRLERYLFEDHDDLFELINNCLMNVFDLDEINHYDELIEELYKVFMSLKEVNHDEIIKSVINRYFDNVFGKQLNSLNLEEKTAKIELQIKEKTINIEFNNNQCVDFQSNIDLLHKAIYIYDPFIIDEIDNYQSQYLKSELLNLLSINQYQDAYDGVVKSLINKKKIEDIMNLLNNVVSGTIIESSDSLYYLKNDNFKAPIQLGNLSTGLKSFTILKMLIENDSLKDKDIIILDEPEIHLHPQWQLIYAEIIVLLQKYFDLSIIVTTHSPYFLDAIDLFSQKHSIKNKMNYYLSSIHNNIVSMKNVNDCIDSIYKEMASPIDELETLRYQLQEGDYN